MWLFWDTGAVCPRVAVCCTESSCLHAGRPPRGSERSSTMKCLCCHNYSANSGACNCFLSALRQPHQHKVCNCSGRPDHVVEGGAPVVLCQFCKAAASAIVKTMKDTCSICGEDEMSFVCVAKESWMKLPFGARKAKILSVWEGVVCCAPFFVVVCVTWHSVTSILYRVLFLCSSRFRTTIHLHGLFLLVQWQRKQHACLERHWRRSCNSFRSLKCRQCEPNTPY